MQVWYNLCANKQLELDNIKLKLNNRSPQTQHALIVNHKKNIYTNVKKMLLALKQFPIICFVFLVYHNPSVSYIRYNELDKR